MQMHVTLPPRRRLIVGISGATGAIYGLRLLEILRLLDIETHHKVRNVSAMADFWYPDADIGAAIASGSFRTMGMVVAPCSARSLSAIATTGNTDGLLTRAADVCLKERRRVVLMLRETPLHAGHIRSMAQATENGAVIFPPVPAFYDRPATLDDMVGHTVGRVLDLFDIDAGLVRRWSGRPDAAMAEEAR